MDAESRKGNKEIMQGFNQSLDNIIFRYHLDAFYPEYRKMRRAEDYLKIWLEKCMKDMTSDGKILCIALSDNDIDRFKFYTSHAEVFQYYLYQGMKDIELKKRAGDYKDVYIISYDEQELIVKYLTANGLPFKNFFVDFSAHGLDFLSSFS